jgi:hypothetical protein
MNGQFTGPLNNLQAHVSVLCHQQLMLNKDTYDAEEPS